MTRNHTHAYRIIVFPRSCSFLINKRLLNNRRIVNEAVINANGRRDQKCLWYRHDLRLLRGEFCFCHYGIVGPMLSSHAYQVFSNFPDCSFQTYRALIGITMVYLIRISPSHFLQEKTNAIRKQFSASNY